MFEKTGHSTTYDKTMLDYLRALIAVNAGIVLPKSQDRELLSLIQERLHKNGRISFEEYESRLNLKGAFAKDELQILFKRLTIGESYFFRDPQQFQLIETNLLKKCIQSLKPGNPLRIWSAGCATGEEPYSIAIILDRLPLVADGLTVDILGTDINEDFIASAKQGIYSSWSFRNIDPDIKDQYFTRQNQKWHISDDIREKVHFHRINLVRDTFPSHSAGLEAMDLILCRNVFIYFTPETVSRIMEKFAATLRPGGFLVTGHAEVVQYPTQMLGAISYPESMVYQRYLSGEKPLQPIPSKSCGPALNKRPADRESRASALSFRTAPPRRVAPARPMTDPKPSGPKAAINPKTDLTALFLNKKYDALIQAVGKLDPVPAFAVVLTARAAANQGKLTNAEELCRQAIQADDMNPSAYYLLALIALDRGRPEDAKAFFNQAIYLDPDYAPAHLSLADLVEQEKDLSKARVLRQIAVTLIGRLPDGQPIEFFEEYSKNDLTALLQQQLIPSHRKKERDVMP